jgi:soluble lytic murein transglycosylase-like protein
MAQAAAVRHGVDPVTFMALIEKESAWNPNAKNPKSTAAGLGQLIAGTARDMGVQNVYDPYQNLEGSAKYLEHLVGLHHGNYARALASYGEGGSYASDVLARRSHYGAFQPSSVQGGPVSVGPITVHVMQPNASGDEIADKVAAKVGKETAFVTQRNLAELSGSYA